MLATPDALMADPAAVNDVLAAYNEREGREPPPPLGPDRAEMLDAVTAAAQ